MKLIDLFRSAWISLKLNSTRSILTMLGIIIGVTSVIIIISLGNGVQVEILKNLQTDKDGSQSNVITYSPKKMNDSTAGFNGSDLSYIEHNSHFEVQKVIVLTKPDGPFSENVKINGIDNSIMLALGNPMESAIIYGRTISHVERKYRDSVVLISKKMALDYFHSKSNAINSTMMIFGHTYRIIGITENAGVDAYIPESTYAVQTSNKNGNKLKVIFDRNTDVIKRTNMIVSWLKKSGSRSSYGTYSYVDMGSILKGIQTVISSLTYFISAIAGISLFIAGIGVMNMMYISVSERSQEIGIRLAVGATHRNIMYQFLIESILLTVSGGIIGFGFGFGIAKSISALLPFDAVVTSSTVILTLGVSTTVGLVFGILPAQQAASRNLVDILK